MYSNEEEVLGVKGFEAENLPCGVGFVIIPPGIDRETYIKDVYSTGRISINGGQQHSNFYDILIDREVLQRIRFPEMEGKLGTPVVWINLPKHNEPIVIACLKFDGEFYSLSEFRTRTTHSKDGNSVDFDLDGKKGKITINVNGNKSSKGEIEVNINSINNDAIYTLFVNGQIRQKSTGDTIRLSEKRIADVAVNKSGIVVAKLEIKSGETNRLEYADDFKNKITTSEDKINFRADKSKKIDFGDGSEPLVLAKTLKGILDEYDDALSKLTVPTAFGPSGTRINGEEFKAVRDKFEEFFSKLTNSD